PHHPTLPSFPTRRSSDLHPFPHIWEEMFGSGRAVLSLRQSYRADLAAVKKITRFKYVRFHAIFHDDMGVYDEDAQGRPVYNFSRSEEHTSELQSPYDLVC